MVYTMPCGLSSKMRLSQHRLSTSQILPIHVGTLLPPARHLFHKPIFIFQKLFPAPSSSFANIFQGSRRLACTNDPRSRRLLHDYRPHQSPSYLEAIFSNYRTPCLHLSIFSLLFLTRSWKCQLEADPKPKSSLRITSSVL